MYSEHTVRVIEKGRMKKVKGIKGKRIRNGKRSATKACFTYTI